MISHSSLLLREPESSINNEHDDGHEDTHGTNDEVGDPQEVVLSTHPRHAAEHHFLSSRKFHNRIVLGNKC